VSAQAWPPRASRDRVVTSDGDDAFAFGFDYNTIRVTTWHLRVVRRADPSTGLGVCAFLLLVIWLDTVEPAAVRRAELGVVRSLGNQFHVP